MNCYGEILQYEQLAQVHFDCIFHTSRTVTTQARLVCGQFIHGDEKKIIGISMSRKNPRSCDVVIDSIWSYLRNTA